MAKISTPNEIGQANTTPVTGITSGNKRALHVSAINIGGLLEGVTYDNGFATYPDALTEVYTFKLLSTTVAVITLVYTNSTKEFIDTWNVVK